MARFSPADEEFFQRISDNVTSSNALPFEVPVDRLAKITVRCLKFFWEWYEDATSEVTLFIPNDQIPNKDHNGNAIIKLPNGIEGISQVFTTGAYAGVTLSTALRVPLLDSISTSYKSFSYSGSGSGYTGDRAQISDSVIAMMEYSLYDSTFRKGLRFSFSRLAQTLNIIGNPTGNHIVIACFVRTAPEFLYQAILFEDYVTACVMAELGKIVMSFDFQLPGGVKINYDTIMQDGKERKKEIEDEIKGQQHNSIIAYR